MPWEGQGREIAGIADIARDRKTQTLPMMKPDNTDRKRLGILKCTPIWDDLGWGGIPREGEGRAPMSARDREPKTYHG
jgi:hypothetical protein